MRGCQRQIIWLKGTDSQIFDEAYFLLRRSAENRGKEEIVREAQRIVDRNTTRRRRGKLTARDAWSFFVGLLLGVALTAMVAVIV